MPRPTAIFAGVLVLALTAGGVALAGDRATVPGEPDGDATIYTVADAGSVTLAVEGSSIAIRAITPAPRWAATIDSRTATEVEIDFVTVGRHIRFDAQLEDGSIRGRVEDRTRARPDDDRDGGEATTTVPTTPTTTVATSTTTFTTVVDDREGANDDDLDDDRSGPNRGDEDDAKTGAAVSETTIDAELGLRTVSIPGVGTVTVEVRAASIAFVSAEPAPGWSAELDDASGGQVEVSFTNGGVEVDAKLEIEHGRLQLEVEQDD